MATPRFSGSPKKKQITFSITLPDAQSVALSGDFNAWNTSSHPMKKNARGQWRRVIHLAPGRYEYKFLVDGRWVTDPRNPQVAKNPFGTVNNILMVAA